MTSYGPPITPSGRAGLFGPPPWHFFGRLILVEYEVDAAVADDYIAPAVEGARSDGTAAAAFATWQFCTDGEQELLDPVRSTFTETFVLLGAERDGEPFVRCPFMWVDNHAAMARGWVQGLPKKLGATRLTLPNNLKRRGPRLADGALLAGTLAADDRRLADATLRLRKPADELPDLFRRASLNSRVFPAWTGDDGIDQLVKSRLEDAEWAACWRGEATLQLHASPTEELHHLTPRAVGAGYYFEYAESVVGGVAA